MERPRWQDMDLSELIGKLREAQRLLREAAAVGLSADAERAEGLAKLQRMKQEESRVHSGRRFR